MKDLPEFLFAKRTTLETLDWLKSELLKEVIERLNEPEMRARLGLYGGEVIPTNERNLTDTRNRVSLIYEYQLADTVSDILLENGSEEFCAYVVANRFPDLELRNREGNRGLRLEVKCLQATSEEKSANFSTLLKDIDPVADYLVVFLWEWAYDGAEIRWDRAPILVDAFAFNAYALAQLRDWYWLNKPSWRVNGGYQGYDLRGAVTFTAGSYKEEEGNYGKLLRLWDSDFQPKPTATDLLTRTETDYVEFRHVALHSGFETLSRMLLNAITHDEDIIPIELDAIPIGFRRGPHWFVLGSKIEPQLLIQAMEDAHVEHVVVFSDKYTWTHCKLHKSRLKALSDRNIKPKRLGAYLAGEYATHLGAG